MSDRHIIKLTDVKLITCVLQNGLAEDVLEAAKNVGVQGATVSYARGTGIRDRMGLMGVVIALVIIIIFVKPRYFLIYNLPVSDRVIYEFF